MLLKLLGTTFNVEASFTSVLRLRETILHTAPYYSSAFSHFRLVNNSETTMSTRDLLRHVFRHRRRDKISKGALPLGLDESRKESAHVVVGNNTPESKVFSNQHTPTSAETFAPPPKTPEPFGLENIAEEESIDTPSPVDTTSLTETPTSRDLEINSFSTREIIYATLDEAKMAIRSHLDTIDTQLALLDALDGFSATISELRKEMLKSQQACEEKMGMLNAVGRALEGMIFAGELHEHVHADVAAE